MEVELPVGDSSGDSSSAHSHLESSEIGSHHKRASTKSEAEKSHRHIEGDFQAEEGLFPGQRESRTHPSHTSWVILPPE